MSSVTIGFLVGGLTLVLLALRIHIGMAMLVGGSIGYIAVSGWDPLMRPTAASRCMTCRWCRSSC